MSTKVFVAYDFDLGRNTVFPNVMEEVVRSQPASLEIQWPGAPDESQPQGVIWRTKVKPGIDRAERVIAFIDLPNANVGFEIGYALGHGREVAIYRFLERKHAWHSNPPLRGHFQTRIAKVAEFHEAFQRGQVMTNKSKPSAGSEVVVLCPADAGDAFRRQVPEDWGWRCLAPDQSDLENLALRFGDAGLVIWIIVQEGLEPEERDGPENAALSVLAGYAEARPEMELCVLRHHKARVVADVDQLKRKAPGDLPRLAGKLHRVTLGVPLALRTLLDLHEDGDAVLEDLNTLDASPAALQESRAVQEVIAAAAERLLLHLRGHPQRQDDYEDITLLALLPAVDAELLKLLWAQRSPGAYQHLVDLGARYSLLAEGDLHPTVRNTLRRYWRKEGNRPPFFGALLEQLANAVAQLPTVPSPGRDQSRFHRWHHELNLLCFRDPERAPAELARALCLATAYERDPQRFADLLSEIPLADERHSATRDLWQQEEQPASDSAESLKWLHGQCQSAGDWTVEERAALALLLAVDAAARWNQPLSQQDALSTFAQLEEAVSFFTLEALPRKSQVGEAYFRCGFAPQPDDSGASRSCW